MCDVCEEKHRFAISGCIYSDKNSHGEWFSMGILWSCRKQPMDAHGTITVMRCIENILQVDKRHKKQYTDEYYKKEDFGRYNNTKYSQEVVFVATHLPRLIYLKQFGQNGK